MNGPNEDETDLPPPETVKIRNFVDLPKQIKDTIHVGAFLAVGGHAVRNDAIRVGVLSGLLTHFEKLFRIMQAFNSGMEVNRRGRLADVPGARQLEALPAWAGSYALPLRIEPPEGEMVGHDYHELEALMEILAPDSDLGEHLPALPERVGDELHELLHVLALSGAYLKVEAVRDGVATQEVQIPADLARRTAAWLAEEVAHDLGVSTLRGKLFRIDTKKSEIRVDVLQETGESLSEKASFRPAQLEDLRTALDGEVDVDVEISEERRPYERTARTRTLSVVAVRQVAEADEVEAEEESEEEPPPPVGV